jgi:hypothetical protein
MSSIIKALKKLEEEKDAKLGRKAGRGDAILSGPALQARRTLWLVAALAGTAGLALGLILILLPGRSSTPPPPALQTTASGPPQPAPALPLTVPTPATPAAATAPSPRSEPPATAVTTPAGERPSMTRATTPAPTVLRNTPPAELRRQQRKPLPLDYPATEQPTPPANASGRPVSPEFPAAPAPSTPPAATAARPTLNVSGIAWQKDASSRLAIINGTPTGIGGHVEGAVVEDIQPDRVRFSYNRESFEVGLGKSSR